MQKIETERKFLIFKPDVNILKSQENYTESYITQIYLEDENLTHRIRKRVYSTSEIEYSENTKKRISGMSAVESERLISENEFLSLSSKIENGASPLLKTRISFEYLGRTIEIDLYPQWQRCAIMEIELESENAKIELPSFISVIKEVTGQNEYSNHRMAHVFPKEV